MTSPSRMRRYETVVLLSVLFFEVVYTIWSVSHPWAHR
jgi:hypothetical protein